VKVIVLAPSPLGYLDAGATFVLAGFLTALVRIDLAQFRLPDRLTLPLIGLGLALAALRRGDWPLEAVIGAALGFGVFWLIGEVFFRLRGIDGLGKGDAKLLAAAGAWLGPMALPWVVLVAAGGALIWAVARRRDLTAPLAFGPWLAGGFWAMWIVQLVSW
jgi:leader peptidase (prepilin peptidase) / N-methyltransferase